MSKIVSKRSTIIFYFFFKVPYPAGQRSSITEHFSHFTLLEISLPSMSKVIFQLCMNTPYPAGQRSFLTKQFSTTTLICINSLHSRSINVPKYTDQIIAAQALNAKRCYLLTIYEHTLVKLKYHCGIAYHKNHTFSMLIFLFYKSTFTAVAPFHNETAMVSVYTNAHLTINKFVDCEHLNFL